MADHRMSLTYGALFAGYGGLELGVQSVLGGHLAWSEVERLRETAAGEGQHVAREVFSAEGIPFVRCSCSTALSPQLAKWLSEHVPNGGVAELQAVIKRQADQA